jgi:hypothetical protein
MKIKLLYIFPISLLISTLSYAQIITSNPAFITNDYNGVVEITFDASLGTGGLNNFTGDIYAHTGVITNQSTSDSDWKHAPTWGDNNAKYKLTPLGNNKWKLLIMPSITAYYNLNANETVTKLAFVFRSADKTKEGKDTGGRDILVEVHEPGLLVQFDTPAENTLVNVNEAINFSVSSSLSANLDLKINGVTKQTATAATALAYSENFSVSGNYQCIATATTATATVSDTINICAVAPATSAALPANLKAGINYYSADNMSVTLVLYAKDKDNALPDNVFLLGDFNDWTYSNDYQLKKDGSTGNWWITLTDLIPQQEYAFQYAVKTGANIVKISDAYAEKILDPWNDSHIAAENYPDFKKYPKGGDGLVAVFQTDKPEFQWSTATTNFIRKDKNNLVIYELWVHDFSSYRTIVEVTNRLDYLESLGINAIELMPITEFDGNVSWGYNPNHFFAPDKAYGTENDYKTFIDECHKRGIAVILDMVFNHATGNNPFAKLYWNGAANNVSANNPWFNVTAPHDYGVFQDYNHGYEGTREYFKRVLKFWLDEYKIDGYRMDLTKGLCGENCNDRVQNITEYYNAAKSSVSDIYFILEHWQANEETGFVNAGMLCWNNTNNAYSQSAMGWLKDGDSFAPANKKGWVSYAGSHDEERNFYKAIVYGNGNEIKTSESTRLSRVPLNLAFNILLNGPKMIWQFDEMGYDYSINRCEDGTIGDCRTSPKPVPDATALQWFQNNLRMAAYDKVAKITQLRTVLKPEFFINSTPTVTINSGVSVRTIQWEYNGTKILVIGNFNVSDGTQFSGAQPYTISSGTWYNYLNNNAVQAGNSTFTLQPGELRIYTTDNTIVAPDIPNSFEYTSDVKDSDAESNDIQVYPIPAKNEIFIKSKDPIRNVQIMALKGGMVKIAQNTDYVNIEDMPNGTYLVVVTTDKQQVAKKIVKN